MQHFVGRFRLALTIFLYHFTGGRIGGRVKKRWDVLLLTTRGHRSGKWRTVPLIYMRDHSLYVVTASAGGAQKHPGWFFNLRRDPHATIQVKGQRVSVVAEEVLSEKRSQLWKQLLTFAPFYAHLQKRTLREMPAVILSPVEKRG